jgi:hypothetical protein
MKEPAPAGLPPPLTRLAGSAAHPRFDREALENAAPPGATFVTP